MPAILATHGDRKVRCDVEEVESITGLASDLSRELETDVAAADIEVWDADFDEWVSLRRVEQLGPKTKLRVRNGRGAGALRAKLDDAEGGATADASAAAAAAAAAPILDEELTSKLEALGLPIATHEAGVAEAAEAAAEAARAAAAALADGGAVARTQQELLDSLSDVKSSILSKDPARLEAHGALTQSLKERQAALDAQRREEAEHTAKLEEALGGGGGNGEEERTTAVVQEKLQELQDLQSAEVDQLSELSGKIMGADTAATAATAAPAGTAPAIPAYLKAAPGGGGRDGSGGGGGGGRGGGGGASAEGVGGTAGAIMSLSGDALASILGAGGGGGGGGEGASAAEVRGQVAALKTLRSSTRELRGDPEEPEEAAARNARANAAPPPRDPVCEVLEGSAPGFKHSTPAKLKAAGIRTPAQLRNKSHPELLDAGLSEDEAQEVLRRTISKGGATAATAAAVQGWRAARLTPRGGSGSEGWHLGPALFLTVMIVLWLVSLPSTKGEEVWHGTLPLLGAEVPAAFLVAWGAMLLLVVHTFLPRGPAV
jgi:hypothetical protein